MQLSEQEIVRRQNLQSIRDLGIDPYPAPQFEVNAFAADIKARFEDGAEGFRKPPPRRPHHDGVASGQGVFCRA